VLFFLFYIALMCWARVVGIYGLNLVVIEDASSLETGCSGFVSNGGYIVSQGGQLALAASMYAANEAARQGGREPKETDLARGMQDLTGGKSIAPVTLTALYVCVLRASGFPARITMLQKTPLRAQGLLLAEYNQNGMWKAVEVTRGVGFAVDGNQLSALQIIRSFYGTDFQRIESISSGAERGGMVSGKVGLAALHKAHFAVYLDDVAWPAWKRLPVVRAFAGPVGYVDARGFDGHLDDLALYRLIYRGMHIYLPVALLVLFTIFITRFFLVRRRERSSKMKGLQ
jgi:hypothetical protein